MSTPTAHAAVGFNCPDNQGFHVAIAFADVGYALHL